MKSLRDEELQARLEELKQEKTMLAQAFMSGGIPRDIYKKTVVKLEREMGDVSEEIKRRASDK